MAAEKVRSRTIEERNADDSRQRLYDIDFLRVCAITAVIAVHCVSFATFYGRQETHPLGWFGALTVDSFVRWCVPVFVMISGALSISEKTYTHPGAFLKKRFIRLLPAIAVWPLVYELWAATLQHGLVDLNDLFRGYALGSFVAGGQLYFLFLIAGLYLLTPFIGAYVHVASRRQLWGATIAIMVATTVWYTAATFIWGYEPPLNFVSQGLPYVGYFMLGYLLKDVTVKRWYLPVGAFILGSIAIDVALALTQRTFLDNFFFSFPTPLVMLVSPAAFLTGKLAYKKLASFISSRGASVAAFHRVITKLSGAAFGVYLVHIIILQALIVVLGFDKVSLKDSLILIPLVAATSWVVVFGVLRIPYVRDLVQ